MVPVNLLSFMKLSWTISDPHDPFERHRIEGDSHASKGSQIRPFRKSSADNVASESSAVPNKYPPLRYEVSILTRC